MKVLTLILIIAIVLSGCASFSGITKDSPDYRINIEDELRVVIWKQLDEKAKVRPDGRISLPLIGEVYCYDKTPKDLSLELTEKYKQPTTVIVVKVHSFKEDLKEIVAFLRDVAFFYFVGEKITKD